MKLSDRLPFYFIVAFFVLGGGVVAWQKFGSSGSRSADELVLPQLSDQAAAGKVAYETYCAKCHGVNAVGSDKGPPLLHDYYNPGHHGDIAFVAAARRGVPRHHWNFGDMPPVPGVSDAELVSIIRYVRELQAANGIVYRQHRM